MSDVFISYRKEDFAIADRLVGALKGHGLSVWWDESLTPRAAWDAELEQAIATAAYGGRALDSALGRFGMGTHRGALWPGSRQAHPGHDGALHDPTCIHAAPDRQPQRLAR
jgi:hypothetical protein